MENKIYNFNATAKAIRDWYKRHPEAAKIKNEVFYSGVATINPTFKRKSLLEINGIQFLAEMHCYSVGFFYYIYKYKSNKKHYDFKKDDIGNCVDYMDATEYDVRICRATAMIENILRDCKNIVRERNNHRATYRATTRRKPIPLTKKALSKTMAKAIKAWLKQ